MIFTYHSDSGKAWGKCGKVGGLTGCPHPQPPTHGISLCTDLHDIMSFFVATAAAVCFYDVNYVYECLNKKSYKAVSIPVVLAYEWVAFGWWRGVHILACSLSLSEFITMSKIYLSSQMHVKCISRKLSHSLLHPSPLFTSCPDVKGRTNW